MLAKRVLNVWKNYITSQFLTIIFVFALTWAAGGFTGLRFALINAIFAGICEVIPNYGPIISGVVSTGLALAFGSSKFDLANWQYALIMLGLVILIQLLQNWLISPLIIGKKMALNPIVVFVGMLAFSWLFGFWGMILAVPIMATFKEVIKYSEEKKAANQDNLEKTVQQDKLEKPVKQVATEKPVQIDKQS